MHKQPISNSQGKSGIIHGPGNAISTSRAFLRNGLDRRYHRNTESKERLGSSPGVISIQALAEPTRYDATRYDATRRDATRAPTRADAHRTDTTRDHPTDTMRRGTDTAPATHTTRRRCSPSRATSSVGAPSASVDARCFNEGWRLAAGSGTLATHHELPWRRLVGSEDDAGQHEPLAEGVWLRRDLVAGKLGRATSGRSLPGRRVDRAALMRLRENAGRADERAR